MVAGFVDDRNADGCIAAVVVQCPGRLDDDTTVARQGRGGHGCNLGIATCERYRLIAAVTGRRERQRRRALACVIGVERLCC